MSARGLRLNFPNDIWSGHISYREFGADYDPQVGFVQRNNFRRVEPRINWQPRPARIKQIRQLGFGGAIPASGRYGYRRSRRAEWEVELLGIEFESGDNVSVQATRRFEELYNAFEVSDGLDILPGGYTVQRYSVGGFTAGRRKVSVYGGVEWGEFWDGSSTEISVRATFRPSAGVSIGTSIGYNDVDLPRGAFTANVYEIEGEWDPTPFVSALLQIQYDDVSQAGGGFCPATLDRAAGIEYFPCVSAQLGEQGRRAIRQPRFENRFAGRVAQTQLHVSFIAGNRKELSRSPCIFPQTP